MLTLQDCIALSDLTEDEVKAIAEHEHLPEIIAVELGNYLVHSPDGVPMIREIIVDDIRAAEARADTEHVLRLKLVLRRFVETHAGRQSARALHSTAESGKIGGPRGRKEGDQGP